MGRAAENVLYCGMVSAGITLSAVSSALFCYRIDEKLQPTWNCIDMLILMLGIGISSAAIAKLFDSTLTENPKKS